MLELFGDPQLSEILFVISLFIVPAAYSFFAGKVESGKAIDASKMA